MNNIIDKITQILSSEIARDMGLLSGLGGQILVCSELFLQKKIPQECLLHLHHNLPKRKR